MKPDIHPTYYPEATVTCACGESWTTGSTVEHLKVDVCSNCHPFFTGEQRIVDTEGQVDRFYKRLEVRQKHQAEIDAREAEKVSPARPITDLDLGKRGTDALTNAGITEVGQFIEKLAADGEEGLLAIAGFGQKSLSDAKKNLRRIGYDLPETEA